MQKAVIITCCYIVFVSFAFSRVLHIPKNSKNQINKNDETSKKTNLEENRPDNKSKIIDHTQNNQQLKKVSNGSEAEINSKISNETASNLEVEHHAHYHNKALQSIPILQKIHARITRSKDAVWATVTLTFMCVLLVLAVAQSRMWKDHYYIESQGVPLPNFNERVLFKDVMERKISTMKKFFKKSPSKEKDVTELESLLPPSEWDN